MLALLVALSGCQSIIGADFDDLKPQPPDASAGVGGVSGSGGDSATGGVAGTSGSGGEAGVGADGGSAGESGTGGAGGVGGTGGVSGTGGVGGTGGVSGTGGATSGGTGGVDSGVDCGVTTGGVVINEIRGQTEIDFVELYNPTTNAVDIGGYVVADSTGAPRVADGTRFPACTTVQPGGYVIVLYAQATVGQLVSCFGFSPCYTNAQGISSTNGEDIWLLDPSDTVIEVEHYPATNAANALDDGQTYGRFPNGTGSFVATSPTPGEPNLLAPGGG